MPILHKHHHPLNDCELKFADDETGTFTGYAATFGNKDKTGDIILKGAFKRTLKGRKAPPLMLKQHDPWDVIGKWVELKEDDRGLKVKGEFTPGHSSAENTYASLKHGAMSGLSIGFRVPRGGSDVGDEEHERTLKHIDLVEISIVSMPANDLARVSAVKETIEGINSMRDVELFLRDVGCSQSTAKAFISRVKDVLQRDVAGDLIDENRKLREALLGDAVDDLAEKIRQL